MRSLAISAALTLLALAAPAEASAQAGFGGTYSGTSSEGQPISVQITSRGALRGISGAAIRTLKCFTDDRAAGSSQGADKAGVFAIDPTIRSNLPGSQFLVGTPNTTSGDRVVSSAEGRFGRGADREPAITLSLFYEEVDEFETGQTRCSGDATATLTRSGAAGAGAGTPVNLRRPRNLRGRLQALVPTLATLGDEGIGIVASPKGRVAGGEIEVSITRDRGERDTLGFGSGELGSESASIRRGRRSVSLVVDVKRPRRTPSSGDSVRLIVEVTYTPPRGRAQSSRTTVTVGGS